MAKEPEHIDIDLFDPTASVTELAPLTLVLAKVEANHEIGDLKVRFPRIAEPASVKFDYADGVLSLIIKRDVGKAKIPIFPKATFTQWCTDHSVTLT